MVISLDKDAPPTLIWVVVEATPKVVFNTAGVPVIKIPEPAKTVLGGMYIATGAAPELVNLMLSE